MNNDICQTMREEICKICGISDKLSMIFGPEDNFVVLLDRIESSLTNEINNIDNNLTDSVNCIIENLRDLQKMISILNSRDRNLQNNACISNMNSSIDKIHSCIKNLAGGKDIRHDNTNQIREITIECSDKQEAFKVGEIIHNQLKGNDDYINNNIILNCTDYDNIVKIFYFAECKEIPQILI